MLVGMAWVVLAACGGSSSSGGTVGGANTVTGTIGGQAFTPAEVSAVEAGPATCTVSSQTVSLKAFALRLSSSTGTCTDLESDPLCKLVASSREVTVVFADVGAVASPSLGTGTFTVDPDPTNVVPGTGSLTGTLVVAFGGSVATTSTCPAGTAGQVAKGTLTVTHMSSTSITGSLDLTFGTLSAGGTFVPGADTLKGAFNATMCGNLAADLCSLATTGGQCASPHC
jgi:hypothetical protein